ncbi:MAG: aminoacyl-tRNA hydrolase [Hyphomicrobium sp.]
MKLFAGLGNPGAKYQANRHNIGFMALDVIAAHHGFSPWRKKFQGLVCDGTLDGARVTLLKPETFMNESGRSVGEALRFLKLTAADLVVFHDELDLAPGKVKVKIGGGNAGHNGLRSITAHVTNDYTRVRLGIGHPGDKDAVTHHVLNDFAKSERAWLTALLDAVARAVPYLAAGDEARFLTDVARFTASDNEAPDPAPRRARSATVPEPTERPDVAKKAQGSANTRHPSGERANKRQSALAENLKKWLGSRKSD